MKRATQHCCQGPRMPQIIVWGSVRCWPLDVTETEGNERTGATKPEDGTAAIRWRGEGCAL
jgi:hypothetical protein